MSLPKESVRQIVEVLGPHHPAMIYLFGSHGMGTEHSGSDIDIAFLPRQEVAPLVCFQLANQLADLLGAEVDLVDLTQCSTVMAKEVFRTGIVIQDSDPGRRHEFEMLTLSDYARLNEERHQILATLP